MLAKAINRADRDAEDGICVSVEIAVVAARGTVTTCEDVDGTKTSSAFLNALEHSSSNQDIRGFHRSAIVWRSPGTGVDLVVLIFVDHGLGLVRIADRAAENSNAGNLGVVGNAK